METQTEGTIVIIDTNIFMHCQPINQMPWAELMAAPVTLVICETVLAELDDLKDRGDKQSKKNRARAAIGLASQVDQEPIELRPGVLLWVEFDSTWCEHPNLSPKKNDDRILAVGLLMQQKHPQAQVILLSRDVTPRLKAKRIGLDALEPPKELMLKEEADPRDAELAKMRKQVLSAQQQIPKVLVRFENNTKFFKSKNFEVENFFDEHETAPDLPELHLKGLKKMAKEAPLDRTAYPNFGITEVALELARLNNGVSDSQVASYNREVDAYHQAYTLYYEEWLSYVKHISTLFPVKIRVSNEGGVPAESLEITLKVAETSQDFFELFSFEMFTWPPTAPTTPQRPDPLYASRLGLNSLAASLYRPPDAPAFDLKEWSVEDLEEQNGVCFHHNKIKHKQAHSFETVLLRRLDPSQTGCALEYTVHADNIPEPIKGTLNLQLIESSELESDSDDASEDS